MNSKTIIIVSILVIAVGIGAFFAGMQYGKNAGIGAKQYQRFQQGMIGRNGNGFFRRGTAQNAGETPIRGQIINTGNGTVTVKMQDGESKIIILSGTTQITKSATGSASDLKNGEQILVVGTNNSDGSVTADTVQLSATQGNVSPTPVK